MKLDKAIKKALKTNGWIITHDKFAWLTVGYMPLCAVTQSLSPEPIDNDVLHCIAINKSTGKIECAMTSIGDDFHDVKFDVNDICYDRWEVITSSIEKRQLVHEYRQNQIEKRDNFFKEMKQSYPLLFKN